MRNIKESIILFHLLAWFFFWLMPVAFMMGHLGIAALIPALTSPWYWLFLAVYTCIFYLNAYWLLPKIFYGSQKALYFFIVVLMLIAIGISKPFDRIVNSVSRQVFDEQKAPYPKTIFVAEPYGPSHFSPPMPGSNGPGPGQLARPQFDIISIMIYILMMGIGFAVQTSIRWRREIEQKAAAETDKANAELKFLKAQVNPHFLFNSLNNIYSLALLKDENTADSIMQLSNIMRYITDDAINDFVQLGKEVECINSYINLQKLRLGMKADIKFQVWGELAGKIIAPMILLGFVENIFKYGISKHEQSPITIHLKTDVRSIQFYCQNRDFKHLQKEERTGTGIKNIQKRLDYLYPDKYRLDISTDDQLYTLQLVLKI